MKTEKAIISLKEGPKKKNKAELQASYDDSNRIISDVMDKYWTTSTISDEKYGNDARRALKSKCNCHLLSVGTYEAVSYKLKDSNIPHDINVELYSAAARVTMSSGKTIAFPVPFTPDSIFLNQTSITASVRSLQEMINQIDSGIISSHRKIYNNKKRDISYLRNKTLIIPEFLYDEKFGIEKIRAKYKNSVEICSDEEYADIIQKGIPGYIVPLVSTDVISKSYAQHFSLWDSESWYCCAAILHKGMKNSNIREFDRNNFNKKVKLGRREWKFIAKKLNRNL
nr:hypothetical protein [uncultured Draconibacterium sp.]